MKHPKVKVYCRNCQQWTFAKIVNVLQYARDGQNIFKTYKVFGCAHCVKPHLSPTGKFIEDYTILCKNYNVEWPNEQVKDV
jgi:hypothetical protein